MASEEYLTEDIFRARSKTMLLPPLTEVRAILDLPIVLLNLSNCSWSPLGGSNLDDWLAGLKENIIVLIDNSPSEESTISMAQGMLGFNSKIVVLATRCRAGYLVLRSTIDLPGYRVDDVIGFDKVTILPQ